MLHADFLMDVLQGDYSLNYNGNEFLRLEDIKAASKKTTPIVVKSIESKDEKIQVELIDNSVPRNDLSEEWVRESKELYGVEISLF